MHLHSPEETIISRMRWIYYNLAHVKYFFVIIFWLPTVFTAEVWRSRTGRHALYQLIPTWSILPNQYCIVNLFIIMDHSIGKYCMSKPSTLLLVPLWRHDNTDFEILAAWKQSWGRLKMFVSATLITLLVQLDYDQSWTRVICLVKVLAFLSWDPSQERPMMAAFVWTKANFIVIYLSNVPIYISITNIIYHCITTHVPVLSPHRSCKNVNSCLNFYPISAITL